MVAVSRADSCTPGRLRGSGRHHVAPIDSALSRGHTRRRTLGQQFDFGDTDPRVACNNQAFGQVSAEDIRQSLGTLRTECADLGHGSPPPRPERFAHAVERS